MANSGNKTRKNKRKCVDLAIEVAAKAHLGQFRKGTDIPYIVHPIGVGLILIAAGARSINVSWKTSCPEK